ncbi:MAG: glycosyltransferase family 2 protein [Patescibacteria group bacterium]
MDALTTPEPRLKLLSRNTSETADLAVIIVSWNVKDLLLQNLDAIRQSIGSISVRVIVVDNASKDGSAEALKDAQDVELVANTSNLGFAKAVNQGIKIGNARHMLLLNPDMKVSQDAFAKTVAYLDAHPDVGVLGGKLLNADGSVLPSVRRLPDVCSQLAVLLKLPHLFSHILDQYLFTDFDYTKEQDAPSVRGSYFAMSKNALAKLGGLDERFFIWFEEVDYCTQTLKAGMKVGYAPSIVAQDFIGRSFAQRTSYWKQVQFSKSMAQYFSKWQPSVAWLVWMVRPLPIAAAWLMDKLS